MSWANMLYISVGQVQTCMKGKPCTYVTVVTQGCCQKFLAEQQSAKSMFSVMGKPAAHQCWANADLYERQTCMNVTVLTQGCCHLFLQSSTEPGSVLSVLGNPDVHHCWAIADLYERQTCIGVTVLAQGCCQHFLQSSS